jgi:hypothetical protein
LSLCFSSFFFLVPHEQDREIPSVDRYWLLTWTTYGTWLPGDERGFVGAVRQKSDDTQTTHSQPGTEYDHERPHLEGFAKATQKLPTMRLTPDQATVVCQQIQATAAIRRWKLFAVAVMANHVHTVIGVPGDPEPSTAPANSTKPRRPTRLAAGGRNRDRPENSPTKLPSSLPSATSRTRTGPWHNGFAASKPNRATRRADNKASRQRKLPGAFFACVS